MIRASNHALRKASTTMATRGQVVHFSSSSSLIPERNLWDSIYSGTKGLVSLLVSEESRQKFMDVVQGSTINADVLKQARFGSMLTIALFHDLQDPLFQQYKFDASDFLKGVQPALTNFHEGMGELQNEFPDIKTKEEQTELFMKRYHQVATQSMNTMESPWTEQANKDPESPAGQLKAMVSPKMFNSLFLATETEAMMSKHKEGSTKVSYVALLSARAMVMDQEEFTGTNEAPAIKDGDATMESKYDEKKEEIVKMDATAENDRKPEEITKVDASAEDDKGSGTKEADNVVKADSKQEDASDESTSETSERVASTEENSTSESDTTPVAAQIEVLYEMNKTVDLKPVFFGEMQATEESTKDETQIWVGTFEGWLNGGPDGPLRWRLTQWRPPHAEFPGLYHRL